MMETLKIRSREPLIAALAAGQHVQFQCFWGHRQAAGGAITAACLSQWYPAAFTAEGRRFPTAEHYMMVHKAELFGASEIAARILEAPDPGKAKALGRSVPGFDEATWTTARWDIVVDANLHKFSQHPALKAYLLGTAPKILVEASPVDAIWGIGLAAKSPAALIPSQWQGLNLLGFALMEVRDRISADRTSRA